jgi:hypothetical protein
LWEAVGQADVSPCQVITAPNEYGAHAPTTGCQPAAAPSRLHSGLVVVAYEPSPFQQQTLALLAQSNSSKTSLVVMSNIIRNWMPDFLLPLGLERVLYLDCDTIVTQALAPLYFSAAFAHADLVLAERSAVARFNTLRVDWEDPLLSRWRAALPAAVLNNSAPFQTPNVGVMLVNLPRYCRLQVPERFALLLRRQLTTRPLWWHQRTTHQTPFILSLHPRDLATVPAVWNDCTPDAAIVHCTGAYRWRMLNESDVWEK